jgi:hypothetical protein
MELCEYYTIQKDTIYNRLINAKRTNSHILNDNTCLIYVEDLHVESYLPQTVLYMIVGYYDSRHLPIYLLYWSSWDENEISFILPSYILFISVGYYEFIIIHNYPKYIIYLQTDNYKNITHATIILHLDLHAIRYKNIVCNLPQYLTTLYSKDVLFDHLPQYLKYSDVYNKN